MAECSYARCMQERRTIKKHLQKWTKNCIYTLGFERVAEEFMGRRQWRLYQEKVLKSWCPSIERDIEIKDWDPSEDKCTFCDLEPTGQETEEDPKSPTRAGTLSQHNNNNIDLLGSDSSDSSADEGELAGRMNTLDSVSSMAAIAALANPAAMPYYSGAFPRWYLSPPPRPILDNIKPESPMVMNIPPSTPSEMPLDLSAKSSKSPPEESSENIRIPSMLDSKSSLFRPRPRMSPMTGRRTYTEDELQAALRDIQSGKLGTRRAAVIYGIPRSTLRNKVYKLALERERDAHVMLGAPLPRPSPPDAPSLPPSLLPADKEDSSAEEEKEGTSQPGLSMEDLLRLSGVERNPQSSALASYLAQLLKLKENVSPGEEDAPFVKRIMAEERKNGGEEDQSNVILRIPSFKPNSDPPEKPPVNGESAEAGAASLREAFAKSISHKFQSETPSSAVFPHHGGIQSSHQTPQTHQQHHHHHHQQQQHRSAPQGKGTRPKRGKYRNYDRDSLVEAVRAVQRGEMSVHRAGSYYGVPHSTLEYKVKERHLMRPRKREPKGEDKAKIPPSPSLEKTKQSPLVPKPMPKPPFPPPNGLKLPPSLFDTGVNPLTAYAGAPFPFWPPNPFHGLPLPPTHEQMYQPSLPPSTRRMAESLYDGHSSSFLDGIIRSSLDLGLKNAAAAAEKSSNAMEAMSNKALLDQLCRNSNAPPSLHTSDAPVQVHSDEERNVPYDLSRSSDEESDDRTKRQDDTDIPTADEMDDDIDNISNHASDEDDPRDS